MYTIVESVGPNSLLLKAVRGIYYVWLRFGLSTGITDDPV